MVSVPAPPRWRVSEAEYLAFEASSPVKHEYVLGVVRAMAGTSIRHNQLAQNVNRRLLNAADGTGCLVFFGNVRLRISSELYYYPDLMVRCDPLDRDAVNVERPCAIVEVLSRGTARLDRGEKLLVYRGIPSLQTYLLVWQDERRVEHHWRDEHGAWQSADVTHDGSVAIPCLSLELPLDAIYAGVDMEQGAEDA